MNLIFKNKRNCIILMEHRKFILETIDFVNEVILEKNWEQKISDIQKYNIDTFVIGVDWKGKFDFLVEYCEVIYLPRTEGISTIQSKKDMASL